jgi:hypothetical protein
MLGPNGPLLTDSFASQVLMLRSGQIEKVNGALQEVYREFLVIEQPNIEQHTDEAGHLVVTITPFRPQVEKLENRLWSELDAILDPRQQSIARLNLKLDQPVTVPGVTVSDLIGPGFFGWGKDGARLEIWRVGAWYHWKVSARGYLDSSRAPQLPATYRRFWKEPVESPADLPEADTQPERKD